MTEHSETPIADIKAENVRLQNLLREAIRALAEAHGESHLATAAIPTASLDGLEMRLATLLCAPTHKSAAFYRLIAGEP